MKKRSWPRVAAYKLSIIAPAVLIAATLSVATGARTGEAVAIDRTPQEPAGRMHMGPRVLSRADHGDQSRVLVEVTLSSSLRVPAARLTARRPDGGILAERDLGGAIPPRGMRRVVLEITLEHGREHHIFFDLIANSGEPRPGGSDPVWSTAYLRVNLDPDKEPRDLGDVLEYRALGQEGSR